MKNRKILKKKENFEKKMKILKKGKILKKRENFEKKGNFWKKRKILKKNKAGVIRDSHFKWLVHFVGIYFFSC